MSGALGQTVTIVNKSGKIVKTSKHLVNAFNEAKSAYAEKKAEIKAIRAAEASKKEAKLRQQVELLKLEDDAVSHTSSRRSSASRTNGQSTRRTPVDGDRRPHIDRGYSDSFYANDDRQSVARTRTHRGSPLQFDSNGEVVESDGGPHVGELVRRRTYEPELSRASMSLQKRSNTHDEIDMDLAYGELPPPLPDSSHKSELELRDKVTALQQMLDEANCVHHSVTATIDSLQKNPDAMAAVALTLAEISNLAMKLAPSALTSLKTAFPAVLALLASPQFAIAVGVGVGVTVIAFGGYKIVKRIQQQKQRTDSLLEYTVPEPTPAIEAADANVVREPESEVEEEEELRELNNVERWRRGVADSVADGGTVGDSDFGTSVEGEFLTPTATRTLIEEGRLKESDLKSTMSGRSKKSHRHTHTHKHSSSKSEKSSKKDSKTNDDAHSRVSHSSSSSRPRGDKKKKKEPSGLRMLFKGQSA